MKAKPKTKKHPIVRHREVPPPWTSRRNASTDERVIDIPGPVLEMPGSASSMALVPYRPSPPARGAVRSTAARVGQAARAAAKKVGPTAAAEPFSKERVGKAAAYTGGLVGATLAAGEMGLAASKPLAIGATAVGALGMAFLDSYWQQLSQGVLGAGVAQLTSALHTDRLRAKADKEAQRKRELEQAIVAMAVQQAHAVASQTIATAPAANVPATGKPATGMPQRNAFDAFDLTPAYAAVDQAHAEVGGGLDARNAWAWSPSDDDYAAAA